MSLDQTLLFAFLLVFARCSAMLIASPVFGAQNTPVHVRVLTALAISGAMTLALKPRVAEVPQDLYGLSMALLTEIVVGLVVGVAMSLVLQAAKIAGSIADLQLGLGLSQALNPVDGVPISVLSQFKFLLATVVYLSMDGHHVMLSAFAQTYSITPTLALSSMPALHQTFVGLFGTVLVIALQIAAPVLGISLIVDAALGLINKSVPQMQALAVGIPAKTIAGMVTVGLALPALTGAVSGAVQHASAAVARLFGA